MVTFPFCRANRESMQPVTIDLVTGCSVFAKWSVKNSANQDTTYALSKT